MGIKYGFLHPQLLYGSLQLSQSLQDVHIMIYEAMCASACNEQ